KNGMDDDDDRAVRRLMPEWERGNLVVYYRRGDDTISYFSLGRIDPYALLKGPFVSLLQSPGSAGERGWRAMSGIAAPFVGEDILTEKVLDVWRNQTRDGRRVWDGEEDPEKAQKITLHLLEAFEPGVIRQGARWAGSFGTDAFGPETVGMVVGQR